MSRILSKFWNDDEGAIISVELVLVLAILIFGIIPGLVALRNGVVAALTNVANALQGVLINITVDGLGVNDSAATPSLTGIAGVGGFSISQGLGNQLDTSGVAPGTGALAPAVTALTPAQIAPPTLINFP